MKALVALASIIFLCLPPQESMATAYSAAGHVSYISGEVSVIRGDKAMPIVTDQVVFASDTLVTGESGRIRLSMKDGSTIYIGRLSRILIDEYQMKNRSLLSGLFNMLWGKARFVVEHLKNADASFSVKTSTAVLGVRGTNFIVSLDRPGNVSGKIPTKNIMPDPMPTTVLLQEGALSVRAVPKGGEVLLKAGEMALVSKKGEITVRPFTKDELKLLGAELADVSSGPIAPPVVGKPKVTVPVVVQPPSVQMGTVVIQTGGGGRAQTAPTSTTIQVPVSVQPPVVTQVPAE